MRDFRGGAPLRIFHAFAPFLSSAQVGGIMASVISGLRYLIMAGLYGGFATVTYGCFAMEGPEEIWDGNVPPVSPALFSTIILTATFFSVYLLVAVVKTTVELSGNSEFLKKLSCSSQLGVCVFGTLVLAP